ncbi:MAG: DUF1844 domain-containing protein [Planctomycetaceae bacterium]|nr:DUF1844 domain-containing protein [Planctomycetaceae bacterium]
MSDSDPKKPELEIHSDEDWKSRVKAEDARLDAERNATASDAKPPTEKSSPAESSPAREESPAYDAAQLPPAEFATLMSMFSTQAMVALGVIPSPVDGKASQHLPLAKHFIDLLGVLDEKTKGNLSELESSMLGQSLHELRMAYVELSRQGGR